MNLSEQSLLDAQVLVNAIRGFLNNPDNLNESSFYHKNDHTQLINTLKCAEFLLTEQVFKVQVDATQENQAKTAAKYLYSLINLEGSLDSSDLVRYLLFLAKATNAEAYSKYVKAHVLSQRVKLKDKKEKSA